MGKPLITQRRGKGTPSFRAPSHRFKADAHYRKLDEKEKGVIKAEVMELVDDPGRTGILMKLKYEDGQELYLPAPEGIKVGDIIEEGEQASLRIGNVLPLEKIPEGFPVFNLETKPGNGGNLARSSGSVCFIISKSEGKVMIKLPSKKLKAFNSKCRAMIGNAAGGGRTRKPMLKAGNKSKKRKARGQRYPTVRGVHMNPVEHPYGGKEHHGAKTKKKKGGAPGQHVGSFGAKRTGRKKRK